MKIDYVSAGIKPESFEELIRLLIKGISSISAAKKDSVAQAVMERESVACTYMGNGIAVPHCRTADVTSICTAVALPQRPVLFENNPDKAASVIFLVVSPADDSKAHLRHLAKMARLVKKEGITDILTDAAERKQLEQVLTELTGNE